MDLAPSADVWLLVVSARCGWLRRLVVLLRLSKGSMVVVVDFRHVVGIAQTPGENPTSTMLMSAATTSMDVVFLVGGAIVEL